MITKTSEIIYKNKEEKYKAAIAAAVSVIEGETNLIANLANITSVLKNFFYYFSWVGFYLKSKDNLEELILGPFQGKSACTRIKFGKGVCGTAAVEKRTIVVENVNTFPGHIFCDADSKSEIVVPVIIENEVEAVLDIDSYEYSSFDNTDKIFLEELVSKTKKVFIS